MPLATTTSGPLCYCLGLAFVTLVGVRPSPFVTLLCFGGLELHGRGGTACDIPGTYKCGVFYTFVHHPSIYKPLSSSNSNSSARGQFSHPDLRVVRPTSGAQRHLMEFSLGPVLVLVSHSFP